MTSGGAASNNPGDSGGSSGQTKPPADPIAQFIQLMAERDQEQRNRDEKRNADQAKRDAEFRTWQLEQAKRDEKRDAEQAKRDAEFRTWQLEQKQRDDDFRQWQKDQAERDKKRDAEFKGIHTLLERQGMLPSDTQEALQNDRQADPATLELPPSTPPPGMRSVSFTTPAPKPQSQGHSGAVSNICTPSEAIPKHSKFDKDCYIELSQTYNDICYQSSVSEIIGMLGDGWGDAWKSFTPGQNKFRSSDITSIKKAYSRGCGAAIQTALSRGKVSEPTYQTAFGELAKAVQSHPVSMHKGVPGMFWRDTHNAHLATSGKNYRMPDGSFLTVDTEDPKWQDIVVTVEIKGDDMKNDNAHIRGQILQNFINMADMQPRRFMIGLTLAKGREIYLLACMPGGMYSARLGKLPLGGNAALTGDERTVIKFLIFLYQKIRIDGGFLTGCSPRLPGEFDLCDIVGAEQAGGVLQRDTHIHISLDGDVRGGVYGRHRHIKGQRTWAYPARYELGNLKRATRKRKRSEVVEAFFKFQWGFDSEGEIDVHQFVLDRNVPYVPKLLYAASVETNEGGNGGQKYKGEAVITENVGKSIERIFENDISATRVVTIIDIFAGYVHTLIAAAEVDCGSKFALHRDISSGNLMVKDGCDPYVIDWGCGRVCTAGEERVSSNKKMIGTAIYMGIRVLKSCTTRSVVDDLESLFLVL
ncbi:hypothetical protein GGF43_004851, partial [Coemansia sp. RSA 2618]